MAVFDRQYQPWEGVRTTRAERLLILPRYAYRGLFASRLFTGLFSAAFLPPILGAVYVWLRSNLPMLARIGLTPDKLPVPDGRFFLVGLYVQLCFAAVITLVQGPALVSPDLVNGSLPLYLSRPVSRTQYVLGKFLVLGLLLSAATWVPLTLLFLLQGALETEPWMAANARILFGTVAASLLAISVLSLFSLALSAWVKSKAFARAVMAGMIFIPTGLGLELNRMLHTDWGHALNLLAVFETIGAELLGVPSRNGGPTGTPDLPLAGALLSIAVVTSGSLLLLNRRLRAFEVVR